MRTPARLRLTGEKGKTIILSHPPEREKRLQRKGVFRVGKTEERGSRSFQLPALGGEKRILYCIPKKKSNNG